MAKSTPLIASLRWRIVLWMTAVVFLTLASVVIITRSVLLSEVTNTANSAVEQEIEEFRRFAAEGIDPTTAQPFESGHRLMEVYLSRQIPDENEAIVGIFPGELIQVDYSQLSGAHPLPLEHSDPLISEIRQSTLNSGVFSDLERGTTHWGKMNFQTASGEADGEFVVAFFADNLKDQVNGQIQILILIGTGGLIASILIAWLIAGQIIAPIRKLSSVSAKISNSDLTWRVPVEGRDEIAQLARTFNAMLDRIEIAYNDQRQFVDDAGHELRTPITVVRGQLELLATTPPEEQARSIELATTELDRMSRMVNDLLTLAVADSGTFIHVHPTDVTDLTIDIEDKARTISDRILLVDAAEGQVNLDEQRVTEAVLELFGNALRYSDDVVELGSDFRGSGPDRVFRIWVRDKGNGVDMDEQEALFDRFSRGSQKNSRRPGGAGLGLSIVKAIGEAHGGRAFVNSTPGLGSIFGLEIPAPQQSKEYTHEQDPAR
ncbi:sensor histidine kinase [Corynebacterium glutamicum]|uniref:sensor histidine kinase n=1 Tax=Corynebacterium glutamicum TaxID=1718 RepID=UPI00072203A8|nr:HAMP domain-containing sensor histidine kinase [Corynebacterium glutamicum]ALP49053.1 histidine kinase [Corynebacterium glutamicum]